MRCEARTLDDIRALGGNDLADERRFEAAARVSEINLALYRAFVQPWVKAAVTPPMAEAMRRMHPLRLSYEMFGPRNPFLAWIGGAAEQVRAHRQTVRSDNALLAAQEQVSQQIVDGLEAWRKAMEKASEETFLAVYGAPPLQAALGIDTSSRQPPRKAARSLLHAALVEERSAELRRALGRGGLREALARALLYVGMARNVVDERGFEAIRRIRSAHPHHRAMSLADFKRADPRAVLHAAAGRGGGVGRDLRDAAGLGRRAGRRLRGAARGARRQRRADRSGVRAARSGGGTLRGRHRAGCARCRAGGNGGRRAS